MEGAPPHVAQSYGNHVIKLDKWIMIGFKLIGEVSNDCLMPRVLPTGHLLAFSISLQFQGRRERQTKQI